MSEQKKLVEVQHLQQYFNAGGFGKKRRYVQAVDDVSSVSYTHLSSKNKHSFSHELYEEFLIAC